MNDEGQVTAERSLVLEDGEKSQIVDLSARYAPLVRAPTSETGRATCAMGAARMLETSIKFIVKADKRMRDEGVWSS